MRSEQYSDEELVSLWCSWGVEFTSVVSIETAALTLRNLEKNNALSLKDRYELIRTIPQLTEEQLQQWNAQLKNIAETETEKWRQNNRWGWVVFYLDIHGQLSTANSIDIESDELNDSEKNLITALVKEGLDNECFFVKQEKFYVNRNAENISGLIQFLEKTLNHLITSNRFKTAQVLGRLALRCLNDDLESNQKKADFISRWAMELLKINQFELAIEKVKWVWHEYYEIILKDQQGLDSNRTVLLQRWGICLQQLGMLDQAIVKYQAAWAYYADRLQSRHDLDADRALLL